jgi:hypothetical protein
MFPGVTDFEISHNPAGIQPVQYVASTTDRLFGHSSEYLRMEYPPVAKWRVRGVQYMYIPKPTFKTEHWNALFFGGTMTRPDYASEEDTLLKCLRWSVEGKTAAEINALL